MIYLEKCLQDDKPESRVAYNREHLLNPLLYRCRQQIWLQICFMILMVFVAVHAHAEITIHNTDSYTTAFALDVDTVAFSQSKPWFGEDIANIGAEVDDWLELAITPAVNFSYRINDNNELFGTLSGVATKTYGESADGIAVGEDDPGSTTLEQAFLGWRHNFNKDFSLKMQGGNFDYEIGTGFLIKDGGGDGGNRGGFYLGARTAFRESALVSFTVENFLTDIFYLTNNPRRDGVKGEIAGVNLEYTFSENGSDKGKIGFTFIDVVDVDDNAVSDIGKKLNTYDFRAEFKPIDKLKLAGEYAFQDGGDFFDGVGWWVRGDYTFSRRSITLSYRYAVVTGDDPNTSDFEGFEPLAYGFTDYQQWYQGEITGNWIFGNTNQKTHLIQGVIPLSNTLTLTAAFLNITLDEPAELGVDSDEFGDELNLFLDWEVVDKLLLSAAFARLDPGDAAEQFTGGNDTWSHFMLYVSYSY